MTTEQLESLLGQGEGISIEFKQARHALPKDVFESVCAFLNRQGGHLILGAGNDGTPLGVDEAAADQLQRDFVTLSNNPTKLQPPFLLELAPCGWARPCCCMCTCRKIHKYTARAGWCLTGGTRATSG